MKNVKRVTTCLDRGDRRLLRGREVRVRDRERVRDRDRLRGLRPGAVVPPEVHHRAPGAGDAARGEVVELPEERDPVRDEVEGEAAVREAADEEDEA